MADYTETIQKIKNIVLLTDLLEENGVVLERDGTNRLKALCPFHNEKTPSFKVNETTQSYYCYGCGKSGDVISYIQENNGFDFIQSVEYLCNKAHIPFESGNNENYVKTTDAFKCYEIVYNFFRENYKRLPSSHPAKQNVANRNLPTEDEFYGYGGDIYDLINYMRNKGYTENELIKYGILTENGYNLFANRLIFTFKDRYSRPIAFSGRRLNNGDSSKYMNSPATILFNKSKTLYNIENAVKKARQEKEIFLMEGYFDVISAYRHGMENVVSVSGTALTQNQVNELIKLSDNGKVILVLDSDSAGQKASYEIFKKYPILHSCSYVVTVPNGKDPCDYFMAGGNKELFYEKRKPLLDFVYNLVKKSQTVNNIIEKRQLINLLNEQFLAYIQDSILRREYKEFIEFDFGIKMEKEPQVKTDSLDIIHEESEEDKFIKKVESSLSKSDKFYCSAIRIWTENPDYVLLNTSDYPDRYTQTIMELVDAHNQGKLLVPECLSQHALAKYLFSIDGYPLEEKIFKSHYSYLLNNAKKLEKEVK